MVCWQFWMFWIGNFWFKSSMFLSWTTTFFGLILWNIRHQFKNSRMCLRDRESRGETALTNSKSMLILQMSENGEFEFIWIEIYILEEERDFFVIEWKFQIWGVWNQIFFEREMRWNSVDRVDNFQMNSDFGIWKKKLKN